ncbi:LysR substrate-binding domain-containing protein [Marinomonas sp. C2222]|uniref:LysR substrate-binding domain-containing protein n=1 Tax=Marinomonas sargassi TaxID=2984494 RepID=A0ABT2YQ93_9GAMM|nr:LysR substrate-binding domain-containing protein [Marinomonas sargassi]MCV2402049.1 LysR substrate-binding domain-containing protein [Marinomonas sargassi]
MKFRQIEAFRYTMLQGTTSAAAEKMYISQPAVSRLLSDLEYSLGFQLFDRRKGRLHPTQEASEFFRSVEESFLGFQKLESVADRIRNKTPTELKIACTSAISSSLLPLVLKEHKRFYPEEHITIYTLPMSEIAMKLQTNSIDLAVGLELPQLAGIERKFIGDARFVFAMHAQHRLKDKKVVTAQDLIGESVLAVMDTYPGYWNRLESALAPVKEQIHQGIHIDTSHTAYAIVASGISVGVLEPFAASAWKGKGVILREFKPDISYPYGIAYPTNIKAHASLHNFIQTIKSVVPLMPEFIVRS